MNAWMNSSGHRANILSKNIEYIGVGVVYSNGIYYWTQLFASSDSISDAYLPDKNNETPDETVYADAAKPSARGFRAISPHSESHFAGS